MTAKPCSSKNSASSSRQERAVRRDRERERHAPLGRELGRAQGGGAENGAVDERLAAEEREVEPCARLPRRRRAGRRNAPPPRAACCGRRRRTRPAARSSRSRRDCRSARPRARARARRAARTVRRRRSASRRGGGDRAAPSTVPLSIASSTSSERSGGDVEQPAPVGEEEVAAVLGGEHVSVRRARPRGRDRAARAVEQPGRASLRRGAHVAPGSPGTSRPPTWKRSQRSHARNSSS